MGGILIILLFLLVGTLALIEPYIGRYKLPIYLFLCVALILIAGFREVGLDPDSINYEYYFHGYNSESVLKSVEFSFSFFSSILRNFSNDVHIIFLFYALLGVGLKFIAFRQLSELWFLPVLVYLCYIFELNEMMEIRTGILSAMFLLSIKPMCEGRKFEAFLLIAIGGFFHYSAPILLPFLFLSNKPMTSRWRLVWALVVPIAYVVFFMGFSFVMETDLPYIGEKLQTYQERTDKGMLEAGVNVFSPLVMFTTFLYYYLLVFHDTIIAKNKYFPLMMKVYAASLFAYVAFAFIPVIAERICYQYRLTTIILYTNLYYTVKPRWAGVAIIILLGFILLNYSMPLMGTELLRKN